MRITLISLFFGFLTVALRLSIIVEYIKIFVFLKLFLEPFFQMLPFELLSKQNKLIKKLEKAAKPNKKES